MGHELSREVKNFLNQHINSVLQLEALLLLRANRDQAWDIEAVSKELSVDTDVARLHLNELVRGGLLILTKEDTMRYCYKPSNSQIDTLVSKMGAAYATHRVAVISRIFAKPVDRVRLFKETFRLIKGDKVE